MKQRFYLYKRGDRYYMQESRTGKQQSLETTDRNTALRMLELKRQTAADPAYNQFVLKTCLATQDPLLRARFWWPGIMMAKSLRRSPHVSTALMPRSPTSSAAFAHSFANA